jgi:plastocyanin
MLVLGLCLVLMSVVATTPFAYAASDAPVTIIDFDFQPATLTLNSGDAVMWTNMGHVAHTTTSDQPMWDSSSLPSGGTFSFRFTTPGTFSYHCNIHPGMRGLIFVPSAPGQQPTANDGRQLSNESAGTQMLFSATWGDQAALEWVREHDAALAGHPIGGGSPAGSTPAQGAPGPAPAVPAPAAPAPSAPAAPAPTYP